MPNGKKKDPQPWNKSRLVVDLPEPRAYDRYGRIDPYTRRYQERQKRDSRRT